MSAAQLARVLRDHFPPGAMLEACTLARAENLEASAVALPSPQHAGGEHARAFDAVAATSPALGGEGVASHAQRPRAAACVFTIASLPHALLLHVFAALPADARLRCAEVCRGWRSALAERSLWTRLDVSTSSGVAHRVTDSLLRAAAAKAGGALAALDVSGCTHLTHAALLAVAAANAGALLELDSHKCQFDGGTLTPDDTEALLRAAPLLQIMITDMYGDVFPEVLSCLRNEGVFAPLQLRVLYLAAEDKDDADVIELARGMAATPFWRSCVYMMRHLKMSLRWTRWLMLR
jgi:hypothetical protein